MANPQRGEVAVEVNGRAYVLALDLNAMCELEDLLSTPDRPVSFQDVARGLMSTRSTYIRAFLWACLRRHHADVSLKQVSELVVEAGGLAPFLDKLGVLMDMTKPDEGDAKILADANGARPTPARRAGGTGRPSTGRRAKSA